MGPQKAYQFIALFFSLAPSNCRKAQNTSRVCATPENQPGRQTTKPAQRNSDGPKKVFAHLAGLALPLEPPVGDLELAANSSIHLIYKQFLERLGDLGEPSFSSTGLVGPLASNAGCNQSKQGIRCGSNLVTMACSLLKTHCAS